MAEQGFAEGIAGRFVINRICNWQLFSSHYNLIYPFFEIET